ncbi:MAG: ribonuclease III domain-containing protein [Peptoniphilus lacydonensis]|uniref:Mini-ribonuclease 3 n=1 Tax=Peptoniphilus lacydonensis TaxID=1673725 RepID=UPI002587ADF9|nr:ribonuclease III domain-containing protein [Peptoniphilus lacydonensis]MDU2115456.1 ribonuclease III domain-containing protein [Peptoniphilus lacydonensis]MDU7302386.1 ribonuclease III domain-containing protein [Peptoniphilus lacydonensis]
MEENLNFLEVKNYKESEIRELSPLALAYIGDACYEILVRSKILDLRKNPNKLHRESIKFVRAKGQRDLFEKIEDMLTEDEMRIFKRGRNAKSHTVPKNADPIDYRIATGVEALFGYLYLLKRYARIRELFREMIK